MHDYLPGIGMIRRLLGHHTRQVRERHGLTLDQVGAELGRSRPTLWKLETGRHVVIRHLDITALCQICDATTAETELLQSLAAATRVTAWASSLTDLLPSHYDLIADLEDTAHTLHQYTDRLIPDLLQTSDYAHATLTRHHVDTAHDDQVQQRLAARVRRTRLITRRTTPLHLDAVLTDTVLQRPIGGPTTMADQLDHLLALADLPHTTLRILPTDTGHHPGLDTGPFSLLHFPDDAPSVAHAPGHSHSHTYWDRPTDITHFATVFTGLADLALTPDASRDHLKAIAHLHHDRQKPPPHATHPEPPGDRPSRTEEETDDQPG